jgi:hypothetical protein
MTFIAKPIETIGLSPVEWKSQRIGVFKVDNNGEEQIGEYLRNYGSFFDSFFHFQQNGKDLALYSSDYTATRIMELPSCRDIGGEERSEMGFCPVEYFVPTYLDQEHKNRTNNKSFSPETISVKRVNNPSVDALREFSEEHTYVNGITGQECRDTIFFRPLTPILYYPFGFVAGCIWGDENTWKVQYLDLTQAYEGNLVREERFGYIELPDGLSLKDAIHMDDYLYNAEHESANHIRINIMQTFDLRTGRVVHPFD